MKNIVGGQLHTRVRKGVALTMVASLILGGIFVFIMPALAAHTAGVNATPTIVAGGSTNIYSFTVTNNSSSPNRIYKIDFTAPSGFTITNLPTCPEGWGPTNTGTTATCLGDGIDTDLGLFIEPGAQKTVSFSATASTPTGDTVAAWTVVTRDNANATATNNPTIAVDVTPPITTDDATGGWLNEIPATIILSPTDTTAGVVTTHYTLDGSTPTTSSTLYEGPISITSQGTTTLKYFSVDNVGNGENVNEVTIQIDTIAPETEDNAPTGWQTEAIIVALTPSDDTSGVAQTFFAINDGELLEGTEIALADEGEFIISFFSVDVAGNTEEVKTATVQIDGTEPATSFAIDPPAPNGDNGQYNTKPTITLTCSDGLLSGCESISYSWNGEIFTEVTELTADSITLSGNDIPEGENTLYFFSTDIAGNTEGTNNESFSVDTIAPEFTITDITTGPVKAGDTITIDFGANEQISGMPVATVNNNLADVVDNGDGTWTVTYPVLTEDGNGVQEGTSVNIEITGNDLAGNEGNVTEEIVVDTVAPGVELSTETTSPTNDDNFVVTATFNESVNDFAEEDVTAENGTISGFTALSETTYTFTITPIIEGPVTISVAAGSATDAAGNENTTSNTLTVVYDITPPEGLMVTSPLEEIFLDGNTFTIAGEVEANVLVEILQGVEIVGSEQLTDGATVFSIPISLTEDTANNFTVRATDAAGNVSDEVPVPTITEDSLDPEIITYTISETAISPDESAGAQDETILNLELSEPVNIIIEIFDENGELISELYSSEGETTETNLLWDGTDDNGDFVDDGTYTIQVTITDRAGHTVTDTSKTVKIDNTLPTVVLTTNAGSPTSAPFSVTAEFSENITGFIEDSIEVTNGTVSEFAAIDENTYTFTITPSADGDVMINVATDVATDEAGNGNAAGETPLTLVYDITPPALESVSIYSSNENETLAKVGETITLIILSDEEIRTPEVTIAGQPASISGGIVEWVAEYTLTGGEEEGMITFAINFADLAGNGGTDVAATTDGSSVTFDQTAPLVDITSPLSGTSVNGNATITFTDDDPTNPECSIGGVSWTSCASESTTLSGILGFDALSEGAFTLYIRDIDLAGNAGSDSETDVIKDTIAPNISSHTPSINAVNVEPANAITIMFNEAVNVGTEGIAFSPTVSFTVSGSGTDTITLTPNPELANNTVYTVTISINVNDAAGNQLESEYSWQFTTATQYDISLYTSGGGWNLISLPIIPNDKSISAVLGEAEGSVEAVWTYDPSHPNAIDGWLVYIPGDPEGTNNLDTMTAGYGYWISMSEDANLSGAGNLLTAGPNLPPSRDLSAGWNLIGYYQIPGESSSNPTSAFASLGGTYTGLWGFNNQTGYPLSMVNEILPGEGFWISLPSAKIYTPSNVNNET